VFECVCNVEENETQGENRVRGQEPGCDEAPQQVGLALTSEPMYPSN
jgi:hypothetical protein